MQESKFLTCVSDTETWKLLNKMQADLWQPLPHAFSAYPLRCYKHNSVRVGRSRRAVCSVLVNTIMQGPRSHSGASEWRESCARCAYDLAVLVQAAFCLLVLGFKVLSYFQFGFLSLSVNRDHRAS